MGKAAGVGMGKWRLAKVADLTLDRDSLLWFLAGDLGSGF